MALSELDVSLPTAQGIATYPAGATFGPRLMREWEFVWVLEGDAEYHREAGDEKVEVAAPAGSIVLCQPDATDFFRWDAQRRTRHAYFHFQVRRLPLSWPARAQWPLVRVPPEGDILRPLFRFLLTWSERGQSTHSEPDPLLAQECRLSIAHLLANFVGGHIGTSDVTYETWPEPVERAWHAIHERVEEKANAVLTLHDLASAAYTTPEHLCRVFKATTGWTPMEALRLARLDRAATLLARSNYSVAEIAALCGFSSAYHFSRRFKEAYGQSPRDLRAAIREGIHPPLPRLLMHRQINAAPE